MGVKMQFVLSQNCAMKHLPLAQGDDFFSYLKSAQIGAENQLDRPILLTSHCLTTIATPITYSVPILNGSL